MAFQTIPILDYSQANDPKTKPAFLKDLRDAILRIGFLYLSNTGIEPDFFDQVCREGIAFFDLPEEEKARIEMKNQPSFCGWSRLGNETTAVAADWREQLDLTTSHEEWKEGNPLYYHLFGPNQWPDEILLPKFRAAFEEYLRRMAGISMEFTRLVAQSLELPRTAFDGFFDEDQFHRLKIIKYPNDPSGHGQGVGPHKDVMLSSYLLQASHHKGLQVQNRLGEWIDCPPVPNTLVVNIGQGLEAITDGVCVATTHRVLSPEEGEGSRYSVPFFQGVSFDARFETMSVPQHVHDLRNEILEKDGIVVKGGDSNGVQFEFIKGMWEHLGDAMLMNRVKSHPDVGQRWYPELWKKVNKM